MSLSGSVEGSNNGQNSVQKCPRSSPTQHTPHRQQKRIPLRELATDDDDADNTEVIAFMLFSVL